LVFDHRVDFLAIQKLKLEVVTESLCRSLWGGDMILIGCIDRVLISYGWSRGWGLASLWVLPRTISDHCPFVLKYENKDWGLNLSGSITFCWKINCSRRWWKILGGIKGRVVGWRWC